MSEPQNDSNTTRHDVGRFLLLPQGVYDATYNYEQLDLVQKECAVYMSRKSNNIGHAVSDTEWWTKLFDVAEAIRAALSVDAPEAQGADNVAFLMAIDVNGQACSIRPKDIVDYVIKHLLDYDIMATSLTVNQSQQQQQQEP